MIWLTFAVSLAISGPSASAEGRPKSAVQTDDICAEHPDLCGDEEVKRETKPKRSATRSTVSGRCRKKGEAYSLDDAHLPVCAATQTAKAKKKKKKKNDDDSFNDLLDQMDDGEESAEREPASERPTRRISFTSYLNANANHPSIGGRLGGQQEAFIVPTRSATLTAPSSVSVPVGDSNADGQSMRDFPAAPPASSSSSSTNQNQ